MENDRKINSKKVSFRRKKKMTRKMDMLVAHNRRRIVPVVVQVGNHNHATMEYMHAGKVKGVYFFVTNIVEEKGEKVVKGLVSRVEDTEMDDNGRFILRNPDNKGVPKPYYKEFFEKDYEEILKMWEKRRR